MRKAFASVLLIGSAVIGITTFAWAQNQASQTSSRVPTPAFISTALRNQERASGGSLTIDYTGEWNKYGSKESYVHSITRYHYTRTADAFYMEKQEKENRTVYFYDKSAKKNKNFLDWPNSPSVTIEYGKPEGFTNFETYETTLYPLYEGPLCDRIEHGKVDPQMVSINGHKCWRIIIPAKYPRLRQYVVYVDPAKGYNPRRIVFNWNNKPDVINYRDYWQARKGFWFPKTMTLNYSSETNPKESCKIVNTVSKIVVGKQIPKEKLDFKVPPGTPTTDYTKKKRR